MSSCDTLFKNIFVYIVDAILDPVVIVLAIPVNVLSLLVKLFSDEDKRVKYFENPKKELQVSNRSVKAFLACLKELKLEI